MFSSDALAARIQDTVSVRLRAHHRVRTVKVLHPFEGILQADGPEQFAPGMPMAAASSARILC
jgi:hypothetical protein